MAYDKPLPTIDRWNEPFWTAARAGKLQIQTCEDCSHWWFPPSPICPNCLSKRVAWKDASGSGTIWSRCRFHHIYDQSFAQDAPYNVVMVELDEGPMFITNIVNRPWDEIEIGQRVQATFDPVTEDVSLLRFEVAQD